MTGDDANKHAPSVSAAPYDRALPDALAIAWRSMLLRHLPGGRGRRLSTLADWERDRAGSRASIPDGYSGSEHLIQDDGDPVASAERAQRARQRRAIERAQDELRDILACSTAVAHS